LAITLATAACAAAPEPVVHGAGASGARCDAAPVQDLIGRAPSPALGADAVRRSHSRVVRWIRPGDRVTMDFREDRLDIYLDTSGKVERLTCG
jgi:hypothetical protein